MQQVEILYEDGDILVVNKPAGMVVHPAPGNYTDTLVEFLSSKGPIAGADRTRPGIVHRLDKDTSGLMVIAKTDAALDALARQFKERTVKKIYIALVEGIVHNDSGEIALPIGRHPRDRKKMSIRFVGARDAKTSFEVLGRFENVTPLETSQQEKKSLTGFTMLKALPKTGRTHQIRVHLAYLGHPILGDEKYGHKGVLNRTALHASGLGFVHPRTGEYMEFSCDLPADMKILLAFSKGK